MAQLFLNNARATLAEAIDDQATTLTVTGAVNLPSSLAEDDFFLLTLFKDEGRYGQDVEIVKVTAIDGDDLTVERGQEDTDAVSHDTGELIEARLTSGALDAIEQAIQSVEFATEQLEFPFPEATLNSKTFPGEAFAIGSIHPSDLFSAVDHVGVMGIPSGPESPISLYLSVQKAAPDGPVYTTKVQMSAGEEGGIYMEAPLLRVDTDDTQFSGPVTLSDEVAVDSDLSVSGEVTFDSALSLGSGGTGATDAEGARANLDVYSASEVDSAVAAAERPAGVAEMAASGATLPEKWMAMDGRVVDENEYPAITGVLVEAPYAAVVEGTPDLQFTAPSAAFSPDSAYLAVGEGDDPYYAVIDTSDWTKVSGLPSIDDRAEGLAFSPDGDYLAVSHDGLTVIDTSDWSVVSGTPTFGAMTYGVAFSPNGAYLAITHFGSPGCTIIDTSDWSVVSGTPDVPGVGYGVAFSPNGDYLAVVSSRAPYLTVIDTSDWSIVSGTPSLPGSGESVAFSPDGSYLALGHGSGSHLTILNTSDWSEVSGVYTPPNTGHAIAFSPDGKYLVVGHFGTPYLTMIDTSDWSEVSDRPTTSDACISAAFSPDGTYLAAGYAASPALTVIGPGVALPDLSDTAPSGFEYWIKVE